MQGLLAAQGITIAVEHDKKIVGLSGQEHQIDVYWEHRLGGLLFRVAIDCKNYNRAVEVAHVRNMLGVLQDVPGLRGVLVTSSGFQEGALKLAAAHQIQLHVIREAVEADYDGLIRRIELQMNLVIPTTTKLNVRINKEWFEQNRRPEFEFAVGSMGVGPAQAEVEDMEAGTRTRVDQLINESVAKSAPPHEHSINYKNTYLHTPGRPPVRIDGIDWAFTMNTTSDLLTIESPLAEAIIRDEIQGNLVFVEKDGRLTGDLAAYGIKQS